MAREKFVMHTIEIAIKQPQMTTSRRDLRMRQVFARGFSGLTAGNHGSKCFTDPYKPGPASFEGPLVGEDC